jgi:hypothetical protein
VNPSKFIDLRFILETKFGNPTRMKGDEVRVYWGDWVLREAAGDPFAFLDEDQDGTHPQPPPNPDFAIDEGILLPCQCETTAVRTICLQQLVAKKGDSGKTFHKLVGLVDALEVSSLLVMIFPLYLISF